MAVLSKIPDTTGARIYRGYLASADREERGYLGASVLGGECTRALWYAFRWVYPMEELSGRKLRLFDTGHREELRVINDLRRGGITVFGQQTGFSALGGHLRGHIDGVVSGLPEAPKTPHLLEIKTHNDKSFKDLLVKGLKVSKPVHYAQMILYMHQLEYARGIYIAVNKNDESIYTERISHSGFVKEAKAMLDKAEYIILTSFAPSKLHEDQDKPSAYVCGWCPAKGVCHDGAWARVNCRTCVSATALLGGKDGEWYCEKHQKKLTPPEQKAGCPCHLYLPSLVPGKQIDADPEAHTVTYLMHNGEEWTDGQRTS